MHWKEILPVDQYWVMYKAPQQAYDSSSITLLYQPLIGAEAAALYQTFVQQAFYRKTFSQVTHHFLMVVTGQDLEAIYRARKKLEGVGLLKVFEKKSDSPRRFVYELLPPLPADRFFADELLSHFLLSQIGPKAYERIQSALTIPQLDSGTDMQEVTAAFNDVFRSVKASELVSEHSVTHEPVQQSEPQGAPYRHSFDFDLLYQHLSDVIISKEAFSDEIKEAIEKLAFLYQLGPAEMSQIIQSAFLHNGELETEELRRAVQKHYSIETGDEHPAFSERIQPPEWREMDEREAKTDEEKQVATFEQISPYHFLEYLSGGGKPPAADLKIIETIMFDQKLPPGVVNVLIHYIMYTNDHKLIKAHVEKIAGHWARKKVKTVREAMAFARSEHKKYQEWKQTKQQRGGGRTYKKQQPYNPRKERLPKWMKEDETTEPESTSPKRTEQQEQRKKRLEQFLNNI